ncbi:MAG: glycosyltransferase family 4 protein [Terriglobales bacterium]
MRILILTQYYPPETGAAQNRLRDWAEYLSQAGHAVTVVTSFPNYPRGEVFEGFRGGFFLEEKHGNFKVLRCWTVVTKSRAFFLRLANYFSFVFTSLLAGIARTGKQDVILVEMPPLFLGLSALCLKSLKRTRMALNVSDLWPKSAVALGVLKNQWLIRWATRLEEHLYSKADLITGQTAGIVEDIIKRFPEKTVAWVPNGVGGLNPLLPKPDRRDHQFIRDQLQLGDKFAVVYAGLHGMAQGLDTVLRAAEALKDQGEIVFVFIGDGPEKRDLEQRARDLRLANVRFYPPVPSAGMPEILAALDVAIVPLKKHDLFRGALPSKILAAMEAGLPIVLAVQGEAQVLVETAQCGLCVEPEEPAEMAAAVSKLFRDRELRVRLGENGRSFVEQHYDRAQIAKRLEKLLMREAPSHGAPGLQREGFHEG